VLTLPSRRVVADAGANALVEVAANGVTSTLAVFPSQMVPAPPFLGLPPGTLIPSQAVPTSVALGPDGAIYVDSSRSSVPGRRRQRLACRPEGVPECGVRLPCIIDVAFGPGSLYLLEFARTGCSQSPPNRPHTHRARRRAIGRRQTELIAPGGVAIAPDGGICRGFRRRPAADRSWWCRSRRTESRAGGATASKRRRGRRPGSTPA
jgi:hypothetical protein